MKKNQTKKWGMLLMGLALLFGAVGCDRSDPSLTTTSTRTVTEAKSEESKSKQTEEVQAEAADYIIAVSSQNSWENNDKTCTQFEGVIKNQSKQDGQDWNVTIPVPEEAALENGWNGTYTIENNTLTITPAEYNNIISAGGEVTFGFILDTESEYDLKDVVLHMDGKDYAMKTAQGQEVTTQETAESTTQERRVISGKKEKNPLAEHGALAVKGTDLVDQNGDVYQLKGVSTHGLAWFPDYVNQDAFEALSDYGVNAIRLAMYTAEYGGYCNGGDRTQLENLIDQGVEACTALGMYVIIDWHVLSDADPNVYASDAKTFFEKMSKKYAKNENVLYEICNEPCNGTTWEQIRDYAKEMIPIIRKNDPDAIIIVGTPNWSQDVDVAAKDPIDGYENIMYAAHFYAATHKDDLRNKVKAARKDGLAVIISECSICDASGNGAIDYDEAEKWMDLIDDTYMSVFAWNLSNKDEQSSLLKSSVTKTSGFGEDDFSETGKWFMKKYSR